MNKREFTYRGALTREQFLFQETRITARLILEGLSDDEIRRKIMEENLFQYPTDKNIKSISIACLRRLHLLSDSLIELVANGSIYDAKQAVLYALMKDNKLIWDFMIYVIGEKYRTQDSSFSSQDINMFINNLREQNDKVASWSESTIVRIKSELRKILVENDYLETSKSTKLSYVLLGLQLELELRNNNEISVMSAFNHFE